GDQATYHRGFDAPLTADTEGLARSVSHWVRTSMDVADVGHDAASAVQAANALSGQVATLILPADSSWNHGGVVAERLAVSTPPPVDPHAVENAARILKSGGKVLLLLADQATRERSQKLAWRVAHATGANLLASYSN